MLRVVTVLTVCVNFDAKRQENHNLILAIILCRKFIIEGNSTLVSFKRKENHSNILFLSKNNVDKEPVHFYTYILKGIHKQNFFLHNEKKKIKQNKNQYRRW